MKKKILILAANPKSDLRLDREIKDLKDAIKRNEKFDVEIELAVNAESLDKLISENQPFIVHFCGHGAGKQGLVFVNHESIEQSLPNKALASLFSSHGEGIECVLLNACYTEVQADAIAEYIPYVIGTSREILDRVAHYFSIGFYKGIAEEQSIETCYEWGYVSIKSNLENAQVVTSIDEINSNLRKLEVIDLGDNDIQPVLDPLEIILKHNKGLESQLASNVSPELEREFIEEGRRKRYKDSLRNILDNFGQRIINREKQISESEFKERGTLIGKVQEFWLGDFLQKSLYFNTAIDTGEGNPSGKFQRSLDNLEVIPFDIEQSYDSVKNSDITNQISDGQTLLILGEPGSGKTIALLQLAERLVAESRENSKKPIPVVFNLSSWAEKQQSLEEWLIEELRDKYQVPKALSQPWIENQELTLLLDGLDEVKANHRNACVREIRKFSNTHQATEMVVCSRIKDYEALAERLLLSTVICIQPLSKQQLLDFLENADDSLSGLKTVIKQDAGIFQFATTPLILNMMTWIYDGWSVEQCYEQFRNPEYREFNLFESYIEKNLNREDIDKKYFHAKVLLRLNWLASTMVDESQIIFLIEKMQPTLLESRWEIISYRIRNFLLGGTIVGLVFVLIALIIVIINGLTEGLTEDSFYELVYRLIAGLIGVLIGGVITGLSSEIVLFEQINWSWQKAQSSFFRNWLIFGLSGGLIFGLIFGLFIGLSFGLHESDQIICSGFGYYHPLYCHGGLSGSLIFGLSGGLIFGLIFGLVSGIIGVINSGIKSTEVKQRTIPNQGIQSSRKNSIIMGLIFGLIGVVISLSTYLLSLFIIDIDSVSVFLTFGLIGGLLNGGTTGIKHFNLRRILYKKRRIPWNYAHFLDYASELLLMKKVGGGYVFYHRMLMEHFANMELEQ